MLPRTVVGYEQRRPSCDRSATQFGAIGHDAGGRACRAGRVLAASTGPGLPDTVGIVLSPQLSLFEGKTLEPPAAAGGTRSVASPGASS